MTDQSDTAPKKLKAIEHENYLTFSLIAIIIPVVGIILGIVYLTKDDKLDRKIGEHMLTLGILFFIVWPLLWFIYLTFRAAAPISAGL